MKHVTRLITLGLMVFLPLAAEEPPAPFVSPELEAKINAVSEKFGTELMAGVLAIDEDGNGAVEQKQLLRTLMSRGFARPGSMPVPAEMEGRVTVEQYNERMAGTDREVGSRLKPDENGMLGLTEVTGMFTSALHEFSGRSTMLDVDRDGKLTLKEYATGVAIREDQEIDEEGYTKIQRQGFAMMDIDKNGFVDGAEMFPSQITHFIEELVYTLNITLWIDRLDTDEDDIISQAELAAALPGTEETLPEGFPLKEAMHHVRAMSHELHHELAEAIVPPLNS